MRLSKESGPRVVLTGIVVAVAVTGCGGGTPLGATGNAEGPSEAMQTPPGPRPVVTTPNGGAGGPAEPEPTSSSGGSGGAALPGEPSLSTSPSMSPSAAGGMGTVSADGSTAEVHADPDASSPVVGGLPDGARVTITCTTRGGLSSSSSGRTSDLWDRIAGADGYLPDVLVDTGTEEPVAPACSP